MCCSRRIRRSWLLRSSSRLATRHRNVAASSGRLFGSISMTLLYRPLETFQFNSQIHPLLRQVPEALVVFYLLAHLAQSLRAHETTAALATPAVTELVVRPMPLGMLRVLAVAARGSADVVLLADTARMHRAEIA